MREAHFPDLKSLDQIDWDALRGISRPKVAGLATCGFIEGADDVLIAGPDLTVDSTIFELWVVLRATQTQQVSPDRRVGVGNAKLHTSNSTTRGRGT